MSKFKVGQKVVSSDKVYSGVSGWPVGIIVREPSAELGTYGVHFDGDDSGERWSHYEHQLADIEPASSPHYTPDSTGKDYLARCEDTFSREEMIGAYRFTLGKYVDRMGKKTGEPVEKELAKIIDYATRAKAWLEGS